MIRARLATFLFVLPFVLAATSSSRATFVLTAVAPEATSNALIAAAVLVIEQNGFHRVPKGPELNYQHDNAAIWVNLSSPSERQLQLVFEQLRGGCHRVEEVDDAKKLVSLVVSFLQQTFGHITVTEEHNTVRRTP